MTTYLAIYMPDRYRREGNINTQESRLCTKYISINTDRNGSPGDLPEHTFLWATQFLSCLKDLRIWTYTCLVVASFVLFLSLQRIVFILSLI